MLLVHRKDWDDPLKTGLNLSDSSWVLRLGRRAYVGWHYATDYSAGHLIYLADLSTDHSMYQKDWSLDCVNMVCRRCGETVDNPRLWCRGVIFMRLANLEPKSRIYHADGVGFH